MSVQYSTVHVAVLYVLYCTEVLCCVLFTVTCFRVKNLENMMIE
jgi:hypothetical protein